ncbi:hypothetical protein C8J36_11715 [Rhizobium sp. PP-F2F-G48]|nr:hypothetical protein C8J36_11715 [Rhizobium sp. PP-F2F-G48]
MILLCLRLYPDENLSLRDLDEIMAEPGIHIY